MADILNSIIHSSDNAVNGLYNAMTIRRQREQDNRAVEQNAYARSRDQQSDKQYYFEQAAKIVGGRPENVQRGLDYLAMNGPPPDPRVGEMLVSYGQSMTSNDARYGLDPIPVDEVGPNGEKIRKWVQASSAGGYRDFGVNVAPELQAINLNNRTVWADKATGAPVSEMIAGVSPDQDPALKGAQRDAINAADISAIPEEAAANREQVRLDKQASAVSAIPLARETGGRALKVLGDIRTHPGLAGGTGFDWKRSKIPGTKEYDFAAKIRQAQGGAFLEARQALKGGGAITDIEGAKAEQALANLDQAQSAEAFMEALADYEGAIRRGFAILEQQAGRAPSDLMPVTNDPVQSFQQNLGATLSTSKDLPVGTVDGGYVYQGGDPSKPESWKKK